MPDNNEKEFERWFNQAGCDLKSAKDSSDSGNFEWSCFQSQQAAENVLKAYLYKKCPETVRNLFITSPNVN